MDAELKAKWTAALRSGEYKQGKGQLRDGRGKFCCLGVLCNVASMQISKNGESPIVGGIENDYRGAFVPLIGEKYFDLYLMNDNGKSFPEIADYIETNL